MRAQTLPPAAGWHWLMAGFAIFRRNPGMLAALVIAYWFTMLFLNVLPVIGPIAAALAMPGLAAGLMQAARSIDRGVSINLATLYGSFRDNPRTLVGLGALYLCCTLGILGVSTLVDGGDLLRYMLAGNRYERAAVEDGNFTLAALVVALLSMPVMAAYWFAPMLAAWHRLGIGKSLFFSLVACTMNWRPFLIYSLGLFLVCGVLPGVLLAFLLAILPGGGQWAMALVLTPLLLGVAPAVFASFYASYRDIFGISEVV